MSYKMNIEGFKQMEEQTKKDIYQNHRLKDNATKEDLYNAMEQYDKAINHSCNDNIENFKTIDGCFCNKCGVVFPF